MTDVSVLHDVVLAFGAKLASASNFFFTAVFFQVFESENFGTNKSLFKVGVNDTSSLRRGDAYGDWPCSDFLFARGKVAL